MAGTLDELTVRNDGSFAIYVRPTSYVVTRTLALAATPEDFDVPAGANYAVFGATGSFCVRYNAADAGTAATFDDDLDGDGCEVNPTVRALRGIAEISVKVATDGTAVSIAFFK